MSYEGKVGRRLKQELISARVKGRVIVPQISKLKVPYATASNYWLELCSDSLLSTWMTMEP